jgi:hypothetical protein
MANKDFLQFQHDDWKRAVEQMTVELNKPGDSRSIKLARIEKAAAWIDFYAKQLRDQFGITA